jgi:hypothetical protein
MILQSTLVRKKAAVGKASHPPAYFEEEELLPKSPNQKVVDNQFPRDLGLGQSELHPVLFYEEFPLFLDG